MAGKVIGINEIKRLIPHRPPYLMVDRAELSADGRTIRGIKNVSGNEQYFCGHFPQQAIMPGILEVEAMIQLGLIACGQTHPYPFLREARRIKFRRLVVPGDVLEITAEIDQPGDGEIHLTASTKVDEELASQAELVIDMLHNEDDFLPKELLPPRKFTVEGDAAFDFAAIRATIPHRFPFLLLDRILRFGVDEHGMNEAIGVKNVSINEPCFRAFESDHPYLPNSVQMEIIAQLGCLATLYRPENKGKLGLYLGVDRALFHRPVLPGDQLVIHVRQVFAKVRIGKCEAKLYVGDDLVAEIDSKFMVMDPPQ